MILRIWIFIATITMCWQPVSTISAGTKTSAWRRSSGTKQFHAVSMYGETIQVTTGLGGSACYVPISSKRNGGSFEENRCLVWNGKYLSWSIGGQDQLHGDRGNTC